jgi:alpha-tubulin suppressor-like RCC1 family protein
MRVLPQPGNLQFPKCVGSNSIWKQVADTHYRTVALKNDGSLWYWGWSPGLPTPPKFVITPTRIGAETNWAQICGSMHNLALKNDGSLWAWGFNNYGQLGDGTTNAAAEPIMIGTGRDWRTIAANNFDSFAIKKNGTLWGWGSGTSTTNLTPKQLAAGTNWQSISAHEFTLIALKTDGTLWLEGANAQSVASDFVPKPTEDVTQVGRDTDWIEIYAAGNSFFVRKGDGSWWVCGQNYWGELGVGTNIAAIASPQPLPYHFEPWAFAPGTGTTLLLARDGKLWTWGRRLGAARPTAGRRKFEAFIAPAVKRFPSLRFLIKSDLDLTPRLLWELPREVRRALQSEPGISTNNVNGGN